MQYMVYYSIILGAVYGFLAGKDVKAYVGGESLGVLGGKSTVC